MWVPIAMAAAGAVMKAFGSIQQGNIESANAKASANAARYNSAIEDQNRSLAGSMASANELRQRQKDMQELGSQRAAMAEGGQLGAPSTGLIQRSSAINAELNALDTRYSGLLQSRNSQIASAQYAYQGRVSDVNAGAAKKAGLLGGATSLLQGASSIYGYSAGRV